MELNVSCVQFNLLNLSVVIWDSIIWSKFDRLMQIRPFAAKSFIWSEFDQLKRIRSFEANSIIWGKINRLMQILALKANSTMWIKFDHLMQIHPFESITSICKVQLVNSINPFTMVKLNWINLFVGNKALYGLERLRYHLPLRTHPNSTFSVSFHVVNIKIKSQYFTQRKEKNRNKLR